MFSFKNQCLSNRCFSVVPYCHCIFKMHDSILHSATWRLFFAVCTADVFLCVLVDSSHRTLKSQMPKFEHFINLAYFAISLRIFFHGSFVVISFLFCIPFLLGGELRDPAFGVDTLIHSQVPMFFPTFCTSSTNVNIVEKASKIFVLLWKCHCCCGSPKTL